MTSMELVPTGVVTSAEASARLAGPVQQLVSPVSVVLAAATPAVTLPMLALARYWSGHGAVHSVGDMVPLALGGVLGVAGAGLADDPVLTGTCLAGAGACVAIGAMAFPAGAVEPLIVTAFVTVAGWVFSWRAARGRKAVDGEYGQRQADRDHARDLAVLRAQTDLGVATIAGQAAVQAARVTAEATVAAADRHALAATAGRGFSAEQLDAAWAHRRALDAAGTAPSALETVAEPADGIYALAEVLGSGERR